MKKINLASPALGLREILGVSRVLKSGNLAQGKKVMAFENEFSKLVEHRPCVAVNSGTSALHLALLALEIGTGDEVLVPSFTFAASANAIALTGATPVFIDVDPDTFNLDVNLIASRITKKTKAIMVVHLYGLPAMMDKILEAARKFNLLIVEDAAQAHLAEINGKPVGTFGDAAAFSFYPTKNMTTAEGGMVVLASDLHERKVRMLRNQGMEVRYQNEIVGFNLRMTDVHAAIGLEQIKKVKLFTEKRIENANTLSRFLDSRYTPYKPEGYKHVYHQYTVKIIEKRDLFQKHLANFGIETGVYYPNPVHRLPSFNLKDDLHVTEMLCGQVVSLPIHPKLSKRDLKQIADAIKRFELLP